MMEASELEDPQECGGSFYRKILQSKVGVNLPLEHLLKLMSEVVDCYPEQKKSSS